MSGLRRSGAGAFARAGRRWAALNSAVLAGAYVDLADLLALRTRRAETRRQAPLRRGHLSGARLSRLRGRGVDFSEVRLYQPGDDVRTIEWRVTARKNKPHTKVFREERERPVLVVVDQSQSLFFGSRLRLKSVAAAECAATAAWSALANHDRVGGLVLGNERTRVHKPLRNVRAVTRLLADLATENQALSRHTSLRDEAHYADGLMQVQRLVRTGCQVLLISDFTTALDAWRRIVQSLAKHNDLTLVRIADRLERELPPANSYAVTDGAAHGQFHSGSAKLRKTYADRFEQRERALGGLCAAEAVRYVSIMTDDDAGMALLPAQGRAAGREF